MGLLCRLLGYMEKLQRTNSPGNTAQAVSVLLPLLPHSNDLTVPYREASFVRMGEKAPGHRGNVVRL